MTQGNKAIGWWHPGGQPPEPAANVLWRLVGDVTRPVFVAEREGAAVAGQSGSAILGERLFGLRDVLPLTAYAAPLHPRMLGDPGFRRDYGLKYAYVAGEMANGISSVRMLIELGRAGMLGVFGAGGLPLSEVEAAVQRLQAHRPEIPFGVNLIHSPLEPELETALVELFLKTGVRLVSASAFIDLTLPLVWYRAAGLHRDAAGRVASPHRILAKVSREEVARRFLSPAPPKLLAQLAAAGRITAEEARLAAEIPVADDLTAEADSGGHTDNRPAIALLPAMMSLRDEMARRFGFGRVPRVGLGGGIATPESLAAAYALGAAYAVTGSINQACVEAGTSAAVGELLAEAGPADVAMAPSADMFELGGKVQVLKRGTMFPLRAARLFELYASHERYELIPARLRATLERDYFRRSFEAQWEETRRFFAARDPRQIEKAEKDPKHKMALVFRSYLGQSSAWAVAGDPDRRVDYQIWCGPAMGAFNQWVKGSFLESPSNRRTAVVAMNLLYGAAVATRAAWLKAQGAEMAPETGALRPLPLEDIIARLAD